jgi:hypothetical protein
MSSVHRLAFTLSLAGLVVAAPVSGATNWWGGDRWDRGGWYGDGPYYRGPHGWGGGPYEWGGGPYGWGGGPYGWGGPYGYPGTVVVQPQTQAPAKKEAPKVPE